MLEILPAPQWTRAAATHLLCRTSFGGTPEERESLYQIGKTQGVSAAVDSIVDAPQEWSGHPTPSLPADDSSFEWLTARRYDFSGWFLEQMAGGPALAAKMFKFWIDHFPIDNLAIDRDQLYTYAYKHFLILRTNALGNFPTLVKAVSWSEGMNRMLDLHRSSRDAINENWGRELIELFTMGVDGGYTETDVTTCARAFTGRQLSGTAPYDAYLDESVFSSGPNAGEYSKIDPSEKTILGVTIPAIKKPADQLPGDPKEQGDQVIDVIMTRPQTARHLAWKLWRYFVEPDPDSALIDQLGVEFKDTDGYELKPTLKRIFKSTEFYGASAIGDQIKDPVDLIVSGSKMLEMPVVPRTTGFLALAEMGQNILTPPNIAGWPEPEHVGNQWLNAGSMISRMNFGSLLAHGNHQALLRWESIPTEGEPDAELPYIKPDLDKIFPGSTKSTHSLSVMIDKLADRLMPLQTLSPFQKRALMKMVTKSRFHLKREELLREVLRQLMALPEFQMQ